ncbi:DNA-binding response regulator [Paenibacillus sp. SSG-1]|uniref:response regulator transcription factor n=1 Tax=Paenibacillus sp. SSG-1 TaxID=1443669 RepID=UPI000B7CE2B9|nr:response regulator transcription factor [Paenibacillus sp. SSG-1]OXL82615.1 DNA-binding response regulator [Paenibacillus sp. SSG-1]
MKILLAEDDMRLGELVVHMLKKKGGHTADWVTTGREACEYAEATNYDVLILDWMMPEGDGVWACRQLRKEGYMGAILMLTAKDGLQDRINGLDAGADDYLVKPFEIEELLARLRALSRRNFAPIQGEEVQVPGLILNRTNQTASIAGELVQLTPREFQLLDLLIQNKGIALTREVILDRIWGLDADVGPKAIDAMIKLLRKKLSGLNQELIQSIRGVGYKIEA